MVGRRVGRFLILEQLGRGGMATVWKARDEMLGRQVAVKVLDETLAATPLARQRFRREAEITALLDHPAIIPVYEAGEVEDLAYLVMKLVDGETLAARLGRRLLPVDEALHIAEVTADALAYAHGNGVIHRDVTPRNIMITASGQVVVLDFGLARVGGRGETPSGTVMGAPAYIAPETLLSEEVDQRSDIYSLGVVLYEALTGTAPFQGERVETLFFECLHRVVEPPSRLRPELAGAIDALVMRMMSRSPAQRPASAEEVLAALRELRSGWAQPPRGGTAPAAEPATAPHSPAPAAEPSAGGDAAPAADGGLGRRLSAGRAHAYLAVLPVDAGGAGEAAAERGPWMAALGAAARAGLAHLERIHVVAADAPPRPGEDLRTYARRVGANLLLRTTARFAGTSTRMTFEVLDPERQAQIAGGTVDGSALQPFDLEDRLVAAVREALSPGRPEDEGPGRTRPHDPAAAERFAQALSYLRRSEHEASIDGAIALLEGLLATEGETAAVHAALARACAYKYILTTQRSWEARAEQSCERATRLDPYAPEVMLAMGELHLVAGRCREALAELDQALAARPDLYEGLLARARALDGLQRAAEAEAACRRAIALRPQDWRGYHVLGLLLFRRGRYAEALGPWRKETRLAPDNAAAYRNLGSALFHLDRYDDALAEFHKANDIRPHTLAYYNIGTVLFYLGRYDESVAAFEKAVAINPADARAWGNLGNACRWVPGREPRMREALDRAVGLMQERLDREPAEAEDRARLAGWLVNLGRHPEAEAAIRQALELAPDDVHTMAEAGRIFLAIGRREDALVWLRRAVESGYGVERLRRSLELRALNGDPEFARILELGSSVPRAEPVKRSPKTQGRPS